MIDTEDLRRRLAYNRAHDDGVTILHNLIFPYKTEEDFAEDVLRTIDELSNLVGLTEAAEIMGITKTAMANYHRRLLNPKPRQRIFFPKPVAMLACGPIWTRAQVVQFKKELDERKAVRAVGR